MILLRAVHDRPQAFEWIACTHNLSRERKPRPMLRALRTVLLSLVVAICLAALFGFAWGLFYR